MRDNKLIRYLNLDTMVNYASRILLNAAQLALFVMTMLVTVDVLGRATIEKTTLFATEIAGYSLVAVIFLGLAHTQRVGRHVEISFVMNRLSSKMRHQVQMAVLMVSTVFVGGLTWITWSPVVSNYTGHVTAITFLRTPLWIPNLFVPVGAGLFTLVLLNEVVTRLRTPPSYLKGDMDKTPYIDSY